MRKGKQFYTFFRHLCDLPKRSLMLSCRNGETVEQLARRVYPKVKFNTLQSATKHVKPDAVVKGDGDEVIGMGLCRRDRVNNNYRVRWCFRQCCKRLTIAWIGSIIHLFYLSKQENWQRGQKITSYGKEVGRSDTNYGWDFDASNALRRVPLPVLYGKRQVIPQVIQQRRNNGYNI